MGNILSSSSSHPPGISDANWSSGPSDPSLFCLRSKDVMPEDSVFYAKKAGCAREKSDLNKWINLIGIKGGGMGIKWGPVPAGMNMWQTNTKKVSKSFYQFVNLADDKEVCAALNHKIKYTKIATIDLNNPAVSYRLGDSGVAPIRAEPGQYGVDADEQGRDILLYYDPNALAADCTAARAFTEMKRDELADAYGNINGKAKELWFNSDLMRAMCSARGDPAGCPKSSAKFVDSAGQPICSNLLACDLCKQWALTTDGGSAAAETMISDWCSPGNGHYDPDHKDDPALSDPACKCARIWDRSVTVEHGSSASCWYGPCQDRGFNSYLVPKEFREIKTKSQCPDTLCEVVWDLENAQDVDIMDINTVMNCNSNSGQAPWYMTRSGLAFIGSVMGILGVTLLIISSSGGAGNSGKSKA